MGAAHLVNKCECLQIFLAQLAPNGLLLFGVHQRLHMALGIRMSQIHYSTVGTLSLCLLPDADSGEGM